MSIFENFKGKANRGTAKRKPKPLTWKIEHIARDVSIACEIPYEVALKIVKVIIKLWRDKLISEKRLVLKGFGRIKLSKLKDPGNRAAYRVFGFRMAGAWVDILGNPATCLFRTYENAEVRKIKRLLKTDKPRAKQLMRAMDRRLLNKPRMAEHLRDKKLWPPSLWE